MASAQNEMIVRLAAALRSARSIIKEYRAMEWESFTIPPARSFDQMNDMERRSIRKLDRALKQIETVLE